MPIGGTRNPLLGALRRAVARALRSTSTAPGSTHPTRLPIDNNDVEHLMKQVALGHKNWLFVGTVAAGERAARLISLVSSALRNNLDVERYLADVFAQLLRDCTDYRSL